MAEKRRWCRVGPKGVVARTGLISLGNKSPAIECRVIDLSAGGACLELPRMHELPKRFEFTHGVTRRVCTLVWVKGIRIGISYEATVQRTVGSLSRSSPDASSHSRFKR